MAQIYTITDGAGRTVDLLSAADPGISATSFGGVKLAPHAYEAGGSLDDTVVVEKWSLNIKGSSHDNAASQVAALIALLRDAWRYHKDPLYNKPIYITQQTPDESSARYALIYQSPEISHSDLFGTASLFTLHDLIKNFGVSIARFVWRSGVPGVMGSALTLTPTNGPASPEIVHIANHRDNHAIDTIYRYERGEVWAADFELGGANQMWMADNASVSMGDIDMFTAGFFTPESLGADANMLGKWEGAPANDEYSLYYDNATNRFVFGISDGVAVDTVSADNFGVPSTGVEYFIVCWHTTATSEIGISVNNGTPDTKVSARFPQDGTRHFKISTNWAGANGFDGLAKACGVWKTECTAALRTSLYNSGFPKFYAELTVAELVGLEGWWEFGSAGLAFVNDSEGANHLANVGATQIAGTVASFSANLNATAAHRIFSTVPKVGDIYYIGSAEVFFHVVNNLGTAGVYTALVLAYEYSDGAAGWPDLVSGDDLTLYPDDEPWNQTGQVVINFAGNTAWATEVVNGDTKFWLRVRIVSCTAFNTAPANATDVVYNQRTPHIEIPSTLLKGDVPPYLLMRMRSPAGGDEDPAMSNISRIVMGAKSRGLTKFVSRLNLGNDGNPAEWTAIVTDPPCKDASIVADPTAPGGDHVAVSFAGEEALVTRVRITGTNILTHWKGHYRAFIRAQQIGGDAGDVSLRLRVYIDSTDDYSPKYDGTTGGIPMVGVTKGMEVVDLIPDGVLKIPFASVMAADESGLANADLIFDIQAGLETGSGATLRIYDLILIPSDEWACELNDPISDSLTGNSALRGNSLLDLDGGVITDRTIKQMINSGNVLLAETWSRSGDRPRIQPATQTRIYFLFMHYPTGWGTPPLIGTLGMHTAFELFAHNCYLFLRGAV